MPYNLRLPRPLRVRGWKVKIQEKERLEPPHVTVWHRERVWRISLRTGEFLVPPGGGWNDVDADVRAAIEDGRNWNDLCDAWDAKYPSNPVSSTEEDDDAQDDGSDP